MNSGDYREITYTFTETNGVAATITSRVAKFLAPTGQELSGDIGPYANDIRVNGFSSARWTDNVYLPPEVVQKARAQGLSSTILRTTFKGNDDNGNDVRTIAELTINIP